MAKLKSWAIASLACASAFAALFAPVAAATSQDNPAAQATSFDELSEFCQKQPRSANTALNKLDASDRWFDVFDLGHAVFAIYEPHQWQETISYLIVGTDTALLFASGNSKSTGGIDRAVSDMEGAQWVLRSFSVGELRETYLHSDTNNRFSRLE